MKTILLIFAITADAVDFVSLKQITTAMDSACIRIHFNFFCDLFQ